MREKLLELLRETEDSTWVADQLERTLAQGISMPVKESKSDAEFYRLEPIGLSAREKKKRETYETTRAYTEEESVEIIQDALRSLFITLPATQSSAVKTLRDLGTDANEINFVPPDEPGRDDAPHTLTINAENFSKEQAETRLQEFLERISE
ncbi:hypothetical protein [Vreelandella sp.]|uniref:hypothetical protein n=1 Tax=Vreelandella sp. TaxID=3137778 RepID=UPI003BAA032D